MAKSENQIGFRVTDEFKARLLAQAEKERRSVSNLIINVLINFLNIVFLVFHTRTSA